MDRKLREGMRVTIKIGTVEVTVDRPNFVEPSSNKALAMESSVLPTLKEATDRAKELYQLQPHHVDGIGYKTQNDG